MTTLALTTEETTALRTTQRHRPTRGASFDARGCPVSTTSKAALEHAERGLWRLLSYVGDPIADLDAAAAEDPRWPLPHVMKANGLLATTEHGFSVMARQCLAHARALAEAGPCTERERRHIAATQACADGRWQAACDLWEQLLIDHPQDLLALLSAHLFDFARGDARNLMRRVARVLPEWSPSAPLYGFVLGMHAFGLEENNLYPQALEAGHAALALEQRDVWAVHAVAHVHEMQGQWERGAAWLNARSADWAPDNAFAFHNWWHLAVFHLERCDNAAALTLLDSRIAPGSATVLQRIDITALMWRLQLMGVDLGERWGSAADGWPVQAPDAGYTSFNDMHAVLAQIGAGRVDAAARIVDVVQQSSVAAGDAGSVESAVGLPLLRGLVAYGHRRFDTAVEQLSAVRDSCQRLGGSHAQRDVIDQTLIDAAIRAGRPRLARHLLNERLGAKARSPLTEHWARRIG
ncbi:MAG TPA: tetratricopeptide repeat protein [Rubrivivax sp.]